MPKELHEVKMHAQDFQELIPKYKEKPSEKDTKWRNHHLEDIIKRYIKEWDIHWNTQKRCQTPKGEDGSKQTKLSTKFHDGTKYQKKRLAIHQHTLNMDHKMSVL